MEDGAGDGLVNDVRGVRDAGFFQQSGRVAALSRAPDGGVCGCVFSALCISVR